jgi:hypothetical protein
MTNIVTVVAMTLATFSNAQDAAVAALTQAQRFNTCDELAGAVIERDGKFYVRQLTMGKEDRVNFSVALFKGERIAAMVHTHTDCVRGGVADLFSADDVRVAKCLRVPSYLGVLPRHRRSHG